jgi:hypothetical protein
MLKKELTKLAKKEKEKNTKFKKHLYETRLKTEKNK